MMMRLWREDEGILTFEWILLLTLLVIGVIGGVAGIRDAIIHECQGVVGAMMALDQSYVVAPPLGVSVTSFSGSGCATSPPLRSASSVIRRRGAMVACRFRRSARLRRATARPMPSARSNKLANLFAASRERR